MTIKRILGVLALLLISNITFPVSAQTTISGTVRSAATNQPITIGIDLDVFDSNGVSLGITGGKTLANGTYTLTLPSTATLPGVYTIRADASLGSGFVDEYYNEQFLSNSATPLSLAPNQNLTGINFTLAGGFEVSGTIRLSGGGGIGGIDIDVFASNGNFISGAPATSALAGGVDPVGFFRVGALPAGTYIIRADPDPALGQFYPRTYFGNTTSMLSSTLITVGAANVSNINIDLLPGGSIGGTVRSSATNAPLADLDLDVFDALGKRMDANARTDVNGVYEIGAMVPGSYRLRVDPTLAQGFAMTYYLNAQNLVGAQLITVTAGVKTPGIDLSVGVGGTIAGQVLAGGQPLAGIDMDVFTDLGIRMDQTVKTDVWGGYLIGPFPAGNYKVRVDPTIAQSYPRTYFPNTPFINMAQIVTVNTGQQTSAIDFNLSPGGTISGTVTQLSGGTPIASIDLDVFDSSGSRLDVTAKTDLAGAYQIGPLAPGFYFLRADPTVLQPWARQYYFNANDLNVGTLISVSPWTTTPSINFALVSGGSISGTVRNVGSIPQAGIDLDLYDANTGVRFRTSATSAIDGTYSFDSLAPGSYKLRCDPTVAQGFAVEYYDSQNSKATGTTVTLATGGNAPNTNFTLDVGGTFSGTVTKLSGGQPVVGMDIDVLVASTLLRLDQSAKTDASGNYTVGPLQPGDYLVRADFTPGLSFSRTYFGGVQLVTDATTLTLSQGQQMTSVNIAVPTITSSAHWTLY